MNESPEEMLKRLNEQQLVSRFDSIDAFNLLRIANLYEEHINVLRSVLMDLTQTPKPFTKECKTRYDIYCDALVALIQTDPEKKMEE